MKPWGRFIFIFIAYGMILLHTAVPHQHAVMTNGKMTVFSTTCLAGNSLGGFLQMVFSTDLGHGHLETFQKSAYADIDFSLGILFFIALFFPLVFIHGFLHEKRACFAACVEKLYRRLLLFSSRQFRAPPSFA